MLLLFLSDPIRHSPVTLRSSSLTSLIPTSASSQPGRTHGPQFATLDSRLRLTAAFQRLSSNPRLGRAQKVRRPQPGMTIRSRGEKILFSPARPRHCESTIQFGVRRTSFRSSRTSRYSLSIFGELPNYTCLPCTICCLVVRQEVPKRYLWFRLPVLMDAPFPGASRYL